MDITALLAGLPSDIASRLQTADTGGASFAQAFATASDNSEAVAANMLAETLPASTREQLSALITDSGNPALLSDNAPEQISEETEGGELPISIANAAASPTAAPSFHNVTPVQTTDIGTESTKPQVPATAAVTALRSEPQQGQSEAITSLLHNEAQSSLQEKETGLLPITSSRTPAASSGSATTVAVTAAASTNRQLSELASTDASAVRASVTVEVPTLAAPSAPDPTAKVQSVPASVSPSLQSPVASEPWGRELEHQVLGLVQRGGDRVELQLNPRELGPLAVNLTLDDQGAKVQFFSAHAAVRGAVEQAIPQLRDALAQQGIALGEASVGDQQKQQQQTPEWNYQGSVASQAEPMPEEIVSTIPTISEHIPGVDLYA